MIKKIANTFGTKLLSAIINLFIAIVISQNLGAAGKGEQGLIITTIVYILLLSNFISGPTIIYLVPRHSPRNLIIPSYLWSLIISFAFYFILICTPKIINSDYVFHIVILTAINSFASVNSSILIGKERIKTNNYISLLQVVLIISTLIICFYQFGKTEIQSYIKALYVGYGASFIISFVFILPYLKDKFENKVNGIRNAIKDLATLGLWNQLGTIVQTLSFRISFYFIVFFLGEKELGIYSNGVSIIESIWLISGSISLVQYSRIVNSDDDKYSQNLTINLTKISLILASVVIIPLIVLPQSFYVFIFGHEFGNVKQVIWALAPGVVIYNVTTVIGHYFSGTGKYNINAISMFVGFLVTIVCSLFLIPLYGIIGAGITASISYIVTSLIIALIFSRKTKTSIFELLPNWNDINSYYKDLKSYLKNLR